MRRDRSHLRARRGWDLPSRGAWHWQAFRPGSYTLFVIKDGVPLLSAPVIGDDFVFLQQAPDRDADRDHHAFPSVGPREILIALDTAGVGGWDADMRGGWTDRG